MWDTCTVTTSCCSVTTTLAALLVPLVPAPEVVAGAVTGAGQGAELVESGVLLGLVAKGSDGGICICVGDGIVWEGCCELGAEAGVLESKINRTALSG